MLRCSVLSHADPVALCTDCPPVMLSVRSSLVREGVIRCSCLGMAHQTLPQRQKQQLHERMEVVGKNGTATASVL